MKSILFVFAFIVAFTSLSLAQTPHSFKYQAVIRNNLGQIVQNQLVSLRVSILSGSPLGAAVYIETHQKATNDFGVVNLNVGGGTVVSGAFNGIAWGSDEHFVKIELDLAGGGNYSFINSSQLLSVPYALYAEKTAGSEADNDTSSTNEIQTITKSGTSIILSNGGGSVIDDDKQTINLNGFDLSISNGNTIQLPPDVDHDTINEIQIITKSGNIIFLSKNGGSVTDTDNQTISLSGNQLSISGGNSIVLSGVVDLDADPTNELQLLNYSNDTIYLSQSNFVELPHNLDNDSTNEIQQLSINNNLLSISNSNTVSVDGDTLNEIQVLSQNDTIVTLSKNGGTINIADHDNDSFNEIQSISISHDTLSLTNGGSVVLPETWDFYYPDGKKNITPFTSNASNFSPPIGTNAYITSINISGTSSYLRIKNKGTFIYGHSNYNTATMPGEISIPLIISSNDTLQTNSTTIINGFYVSATITPHIVKFDSSFTVPPNKIFVITNLCGTSGTLYINSISIISNSIFNKVGAANRQIMRAPIFVNENDIVTSNNFDVFGYLKDKE